MKENRMAVTWFCGSVLSLVKKCCVFSSRDFAWSQCGRDFVGRVRCDNHDFKKCGICFASHKMWGMCLLLYVGAVGKPVYVFKTRVYMRKMQVYV